MKTIIGVPCMDQVPTPFCHSLAQLRGVDETQLVMKTGALVYTSRNSIATMAIQAEADFVFWLDSDMVFRADTLVRMMETLKKNDFDILSGLYFRRVPPYSPVLFDKLERDGEAATWSEFTTIPEEIFEVGGCGFGCVLMKTDVFLDVMGKFGKMFEPIGGNGEDASFCMRARECGYKIYCDPSMICGHVGYSVVDDQFFKAFGNKEANNGKC